MPNDIRRQERLDLARRLRTRRQFSHPTIAPFMTSLILYFFFFIFGSIFHIHYPGWVQYILFLIISLSIGISGLIILIRKEFVGRFGNISRGWEVYVYGIMLILLGFGLTLSGLYNLFKK